MTPSPADLRDLVKVRKRIDSLDSQLSDQRARRAALVKSLHAYGMSLDEIAKHVGVTRQAVHQWQRNG